jgi:hypothetical protein
MSAHPPLSPAAKVNATATVVAAIGVVIEVFAGVPGYPAVPPGPIILAVAGIAVYTLTSRWRWVTILGLIAPLLILVGGIVKGPARVAVVAVVLAIVQAFRSRAVA